ncbi:armadillo-type protein [Apiosordaria backusii]|uniref:Armadillo-type protein n=1 Tax=Apiosordaria backusii TaxID=314023 RepID=A0AA40BEC2_9PEZI|nr:armadillo-type protein [Apiosordaria backusii]
MRPVGFRQDVILFGRTRTRTNATDLPKQAREHVTKLEGPQGGPKADELAKVLSQIKMILQGTPEAEPSPEQIYQLITGMIEEDVLYLLAANLHRLPFESRKDTQRPQVLVELCKAYDHKESATPAGTVLREVLKNETAAAVILYDDGDEIGSSARGVGGINQDRPQTGNGVFWKFFGWIDKSSFEVAADAFTTFRELLTKHKDIVPKYLAVNFDLFFSRYNSVLVQSNSYVTKRQSIKLLGEILLDRSNYNVMTAYVDRGEHLKICMNLLRDDRKMVQYEGFHVFKVFVANPHKSVPVQKILLMNREKLLHFLSHFLEDRTDDEQFIDEREFLIKQIRNMPSQPVQPHR